MRFSLSIRKCLSMLAALLVAGFGITAAQAGSHGEKIEFSQPSTPVVASNLTANVSPSLNRLNPAPSGFKQVQEDLFRPLANSMHPDFSLEGTLGPVAPQPQRSAPDKRTRELMEQRRNWAFTDLNDLNFDPSREASVGADGKEKKPVTLMEKYLAATGPKGTNNRAQWANGYDVTVSNSFSTGNQNNLKTRLTTANENIGKNLKGLTSGSSEDQQDKDMAGFKNPFPTFGSSEESMAMQKRREQFQHILDPNLPAAKPVNSFGAVGYNDLAHRLSANGSFNPYQQAAEPHRSSVNPMLGFIDPTTAALHSRINDDPTARSLGMPNPEPIKVVPQPQTAKSVQKMLDPFGASVMKPKF